MVNKSSADGNDTNRDHPWSAILSKAVSNHFSREESTEKNSWILPDLSVFGWLSIWDRSFPPVQLIKTTQQTECYCISQSLFQQFSLFILENMYASYLFKHTRELRMHSDLSVAGIWGYLSEINLRLTEHQFFIFRLIEIKNSEELQPYSW